MLQPLRLAVPPIASPPPYCRGRRAHETFQRGAGEKVWEGTEGEHVPELHCRRHCSLRGSRCHRNPRGARRPPTFRKRAHETFQRGAGGKVYEGSKCKQPHPAHRQGTGPFQRGAGVYFGVQSLAIAHPLPRGEGARSVQRGAGTSAGVGSRRNTHSVVALRRRV